MRRFENVILIRSPRAKRSHVKASQIHNHEFYFDLYAGTMCGLWIQLDQIGDPLPIGELAMGSDSVCDVCVKKMERFR